MFKVNTLSDVIFNITFLVPAILVVAVFPMNKFSLYSAGVYVAKASFVEKICLVAPKSRNHSLGFPTKLHSDIIAHKSSASSIFYDVCLTFVFAFVFVLSWSTTIRRPMTNLAIIVTVAFEFFLGLF